MSKNYEKRHYFIVSTIALLVLSPLVIWLLPYILQRSTFSQSSIWMLETPSITYAYFAVAWFFLLAASIASYFFYRWKVGICLLAVIIALPLMYIGVKPITIVGSAGFTMVDAPFDEKILYSWEDVEKVYLITNDETKKDSLEFHYKDNQTIIIDNHQEVQQLRIMLLELKDTYGFTFTSKE
ncbi:hypothetical protein [Sutcliffiella horikoshii]|uniref:hypothetical protein n=1 Tax=Sutcliffiella horikoshii TaxID=79883 RepID=UPI001CFE1F56|nr:hypothetical protein [Sutcliffiella horikoshii]